MDVECRIGLARLDDQVVFEALTVLRLGVTLLISL